MNDHIILLLSFQAKEFAKTQKLVAKVSADIHQY